MGQIWAREMISYKWDMAVRLIGSGSLRKFRLFWGFLVSFNQN